MGNNELSETFFRPARREDASFLGRCVCEGIGYAIFEQETELNTQIATGLTPLAAREDTLYSYRHALVAEVDGLPVGALISYPGEHYHQMRNITFRELPYFRNVDFEAMQDETGAGEYYLDTLAVLPQYRRQGIGRELMCRRIAWAEQNYPDMRISLLVDPENLIAQPLYESLGFTITDRNVVAFNHRFWKMIKM
ncbi:MAG: GNAT family N-acetyltransferase [Bacteroidales bacterium]|nr:GNAT family N-acetyltransferase [Bacteroidales bacterium]